MTYTATYSPEDNKLRLYSAARLDKETYSRVRAAGFIWAPKQDLFVAPAWTPSREDLLLELCGEIGDEDTSLVERQEQRAERFEDYSESRAKDAERAREAVSAIADNIPFGQPILVGHHSERHARKDAEKIENGMRKAVRLWDTANYWRDRAAGAIRHARYKELPAVRARRIKGLEADQRKHQKQKAEAESFLKAWRKDGLTCERAGQIANFDHISMCFTKDKYPNSTYDGSMSLWSALDRGTITAEQARDIAIPAHERNIAWNDRWLSHLANRLEYEKAMLADSGGTEADRTRPEVGGACKCWCSWRGGFSTIQKVNKVSVTVLDNWGNGGPDFTRTIPFDKLTGLMSKAEVDTARSEGRLIGETPRGFHLAGVSPEPPKPTRPTETEPQAEAFGALKDSLKAGVQVVTAPQLFPTPAALAKRMVELAGIESGHRVLEPSAGTGNILTAILNAEPGAKVTAVEISSKLCDSLSRKHNPRPAGWSILQDDFLTCNGNLGAKFDRILMNPPFENGADIKHIRHAITFLKPGGRLVALCANGPRQNTQLRPLASEWEELPADTFKEAGTGVRAALLVIDGPAV